MTTNNPLSGPTDIANLPSICMCDDVLCIDESSNCANSMHSINHNVDNNTDSSINQSVVTSVQCCAVDKKSTHSKTKSTITNTSTKLKYDKTKFKKPLTSVETLQSLYKQCFTGLGRLPGKYHIEVKPGVQPVIAAPRRYPVHLKTEIVNKLNEMVDLSVIAKCHDDITYEWVNSLAFLRKSNGDLRICLDPRHLNIAIKRTHYRAPTSDEITDKMCNARVFSKLDAKHGYWGIVLGHGSQDLCTFQTPVGKYKFLHLPFGLCVSQDIFQ